MMKYLFFQYKRIARLLPGALCVLLALLVGLVLTLQLFTQGENAREENRKVQIALCGDLDNGFLRMGLAALETLDGTRFSVDILPMSPEDAANALAGGQIAAYVVVPDGFMEEAMHGVILPLEYVWTPATAGIAALFQEQLTGLVSTLVLEAQRGVFGMIDAVYENGLPYRQEDVNSLALRYVQLILARDRVYTLQGLGVGDGLSLGQYLLCGFWVVLLFLVCLPFARVMLCPDPALCRLLALRGLPVPVQSFLDWLAYLLGLCTLLLPLGGLLGLILPDHFPGLPELFQALVLVSACSFFLYRLTADLISAVTVQFFSALVISFLSGCLYPVYFFPAAIQRLSGFLPSGLARQQLAGAFTGSGPSLAGIALYSIGFLLAAYGALQFRLNRQQR